MSRSRRRLLAALAAGVPAVAGCLGAGGGSDPDPDATPPAESEPVPTPPPDADPVVDLGVPCVDDGGDTDLSSGSPATAFDRADATPSGEYDGSAPPLAETPLHLGHDREAIADDDMSGGVGHDGIPSIDDPRFVAAGDAELPGCARVFGVELDGDVRAYPQTVLVYHEIVNDVVGGTPVAVTYCPLTGTAQGFYRGGVEFGVSGRLVNSNLVMWDRATDTRWPQIAATAVEVGDEREAPEADRLLGESLREFRVIWTTWDRWRHVHPETLVMTQATGSARNYNRDPYGNYGPPVKGHYAIETGRQPNFPLMAYGEGDAKRVVVGARTAEGAIAFDKRALMESSVLSGTVGSTPAVAVADDDLAAGYVYANPDGREVLAEGDGYRVDGDPAPADDLPLEPILAFDAMWFAWYAFYPGTERVGV